MIKPENYSYESFPEAQDRPEGMKILEIPRDLWDVLYDHDVEYIKRDGHKLYLQILRPVHSDTRKAGKFPCIVYIQGSAFMKQNTYFNLANLAKLAHRGYAIASVEYRPSDIAPFPAQFLDAKTAIRFVRKNAKKFNVDPENIFVFGDSSGGHTALMVGITEGMPELDTQDYGGLTAHVNAVVDFYGPIDITRMNEAPSTLDHNAPDSPEGKLIGGMCVLDNRELAQKTNPINYISREREIAPILILHGSKDRLVPFNQSVLLYEALKATGKEVEFYRLHGADHGGPQFWTKEVLELVDGFLRKNMR